MKGRFSFFIKLQNRNIPNSIPVLFYQIPMDKMDLSLSIVQKYHKELSGNEAQLFTAHFHSLSTCKTHKSDLASQSYIVLNDTHWRSNSGEENRHSWTMEIITTPYG